MSINHLKKLTAVAATGLAAAAVATEAIGATGHASATSNKGNAPAVAPILPAAQPSAIALMRRAEAEDGQKFFYRVPSTARYSRVEMNIYAGLHRSGS